MFEALKKIVYKKGSLGSYNNYLTSIILVTKEKQHLSAFLCVLMKEGFPNSKNSPCPESTYKEPHQMDMMRPCVRESQKCCSQCLHKNFVTLSFHKDDFLKAN